MPSQPVSLQQALGSFDALWSPQIVAKINNYDVRVAKVRGDFVWHTHDDTDEFFLVLDGDLYLALRHADEERTVHLPQGAIFTVPKRTEHKPSAPEGASILMFEPTGTVNVGDRHDHVPDYVNPTTGHKLQF
jgi:mannose-6-phosphate isomerase-like protein (cupin superfamily)